MQSISRKLFNKSTIIASVCVILLVLRITNLGIYVRNQLIGHNCFVDAVSHIGYGGCVLQFTLPVFLIGALCLYVWIRLIKVFFCRSRTETLRIDWTMIIFLFAATTYVYVDGCYTLTKQQKLLDVLLDAYYKGDDRGWHGQKEYRSGYSNLLRWQEVIMHKMNNFQADRVLKLSDQILKGLEEYEHQLNTTIPYPFLQDNQTQKPTLFQLINQSYLQPEQYEMFHKDIHQKAIEYISDLVDTFQSGIIFDTKRLENSITYRKRMENRIGGWLENRFLLINIAKTLYIDGGWIIYCLLIGCLLMIILQNLIQPQHCRSYTHYLPMLCSLAILFFVYIIGFFFAFVVSSGLAQVNQYEIGKRQFGPNHSPLFKHLALNKSTNICLHNNTKEYYDMQIKYITPSMKIDGLKKNLQRIHIDIGGLGEQNNLKYNIFHMVDEFNVQYSKSLCDDTIIVIKNYDAINSTFRHISKYKGLPKQCSKLLRPLAQFVIKFNNSCYQLKQRLEKIIDTIKQMEELILAQRFLPLVKSNLFCNVIDWYVKETLKHQAYIIDQLSYLSSAGLILAFVVFGVLIIRNKRVRFSELDSSEDYSPLANPQ